MLKALANALSAWLPSGETYEAKRKRWNDAVLYVEKHKRVGVGFTLNLLREATNASKGTKSATFMIVYSINNGNIKNDIIDVAYNPNSNLTDLQILLGHLNHVAQLNYGQFVLHNWWRLPDDSCRLGSGSVDDFHTTIEAGEHFTRGY